MKGRYVVWGYGKSWVVHWHDGERITWSSQWSSSEREAYALLRKLNDDLRKRIRELPA